MLSIKPKKKVSIFVPSWFTPTQHGKYGEHETYMFAVTCLQRLIDATPRSLYELIILDNGSEITKYDLGKSGIDKLACYKKGNEGMFMLPDWYWNSADILIRNKNNYGFAPAVNQGVALATGEYFICLNNDILVWPGWLEAMIKDFEMQHEPPCGVLMPALVRGIRDAREATALETIDLTKNAGEFSPGAEFGSLWMAKTETLRKIALEFRDGYQVMDENFKLGFGEDRLLWIEIRQLGLQTYRTHNTRVFHQGNMSMGKVPDRKNYTGPNREYLAEKKKKYGLE